MKWFFGVCIMMLVSLELYAIVGCMDNSYHLTQPFDNKDYHYVACNCPCIQRAPDRNKCLQCGHFHEAKPVVIIQNVLLKRSSAANQNNTLFARKGAADWLHIFVKRYTWVK